ncbi:MAG: hypothetical protein EOP48_25095 [Sphingobacteriales bacterium]|nr:MAG: hypothetical protein EOP48_25095 [Sphingobacteriales bacterium]
MARSILFLLFLLAVKISTAQNTAQDNLKLLEFYQNQKYAEAADYLVSIHPQTTDVKVMAQIGSFKLMANQLPDAEKYFLMAYQQDTTNLSVIQNLARVNGRRGNNVLTRKYLEKILARDTLNFSVYKQLAALITTDAPLQLTYLEKANLLNPLDPEVANDLGELYYNKKSYIKSYRVLNLALMADSFNMVLLKKVIMLSITTQHQA